MKHNYTHELQKINHLATEMDSLYHLISLKLGIPDSISVVLYTLYERGSGCLLSDIYKAAFISKQTVNSAIRSLERDGIVYLENHDGRSKRVMLTEKGAAYTRQTAGRIRQAEIDAFASWTEDEIQTHIRLLEKFNACFRQQIEKLQQERSGA